MTIDQVLKVAAQVPGWEMTPMGTVRTSIAAEGTGLPLLLCPLTAAYWVLYKKELGTDCFNTAARELGVTDKDAHWLLDAADRMCGDEPQHKKTRAKMLLKFGLRERGLHLR